MDTLNPHMTPLLILKNTKFCGSLNINELKNLKLYLKLHFLACKHNQYLLNVMIFSQVLVTSYEDLECKLL